MVVIVVELALVAVAVSSSSIGSCSTVAVVAAITVGVKGTAVIATSEIRKKRIKVLFLTFL